MKVCEMLKEMRKKIGYTQEEVAKRLQVSRTTYVQYETGKRAVTAEMFFEIMQIFKDDFVFSEWKYLFFEAIETGDVEKVKEYIQKGIDIEVCKGGYRPFLYACVHNQPKVLSCLIEAGSPYVSDHDSEWNYEETNGAGKLMYALQDKYFEIAKILIHTNQIPKHELDFIKNGGGIFLSFKARLFFQFEMSGNPIPLDKLDIAVQKLLKKDEEKLIENHLNVVDCIAKHYENRGLTQEQLKEAGMIGLQKAASKYDVDSGHSFKTYSSWWIRQAIVRSIADDTGITPTYLYHLYQRVEKLYTEELEKTGKRMTKEEIAKKLDVEVARLDKIEKTYNGTVVWKQK